jgi:hypothetical protein
MGSNGSPIPWAPGGRAAQPVAHATDAAAFRSPLGATRSRPNWGEPPVTKGVPAAAVKARLRAFGQMLGALGSLFSRRCIEILFERLARNVTLSAVLTYISGRVAHDRGGVLLPL